jgi:hypothetical protein
LKSDEHEKERELGGCSLLHYILDTMIRQEPFCGNALMTAQMRYYGGSMQEETKLEGFKVRLLRRHHLIGRPHSLGAVQLPCRLLQ